MATKSKGNNNKTYLIAGAILLGVAGYFGYNWWKKRKASKDEQPLIPTPPASTVQETPQGTTQTETVTVSATANPFKTKDEVLKFQQWVINTKKDKTILGKGGSTGYGDDGSWGSKSASAWDKYGKEYLTGSQSGSGTQIYPELEKDITTIVTNCRGQKAERSYLRSTALKYPSFVKTWASAVRNRLSTGGKQSTTFIWGNKIYDSYKADVVAETLILGKTAYKKSSNVWAFETPNKNSFVFSVDSYTNNNLGEVKAYRYNDDQGIFFVYIPNGSQPRWFSIKAIEKFV